MVSVESVLRDYSKRIRKYKGSVLADAYSNNHVGCDCGGRRNMAGHCVKGSISSILRAQTLDMKTHSARKQGKNISVIIL